MSNGNKIDYVQQCVHLGTTIFSDISIKNFDNAVNNIYNNLMADFSYAESTTLSLLYNTFCMNVYGSQLWRLNNVERFYVAWRKNN